MINLPLITTENETSLDSDTIYVWPDGSWALASEVGSLTITPDITQLHVSEYLSPEDMVVAHKYGALSADWYLPTKA